LAPIRRKTPVFVGFLRVTGWKVVPGGGIEPPTRGFSIETAIVNQTNTINYMSVKLVCAKICY